jgi:EAL domain-containing protein (putative c-di-GMP-specific phosphodiesterase class I)
LGRWALKKACQDVVDLTGPSAGLDVAVNLSARHLAQPDVLTHVQDALLQSGLDPQRLLVEVTESAFMEDADAAGVALEAMRRLGVRIAIDDFGTGYSSLLYLRRYPSSALKLDRAFVAGITLNPDDRAICSSVVSLAHAVGATSIAEGVETLEQYAALRRMGCQHAQGFLWSPAVPIKDLPDVLLSCRAAPRPLPVRPELSAVRRLEQEVDARIASLHGSGVSPHTIAAVLNHAAVHDPSGALWTASAVVRRIDAREPRRHPAAHPLLAQSDH